MLLGNEYEAELRDYVELDERILWSGKPRKGIRFQPMDIFLIPFSLIWLSFACFWVFMAAETSIFFALFGVPFVLIGLVLVFGRFIFSSLNRSNTYYGLTKDRVIIISGIFNKKINSIYFVNLSEIELEENKNGRGTVYLGNKRRYATHKDLVGLMNSQGMAAPRLIDINQASDVYRTILKLQRQSKD